MIEDPQNDNPEHDQLERDHPEEACGVFGISLPNEAVSYLTFDGIYALQHRGQESAGMAVADNGEITVVKNLGLVSAVFDDSTLASLPGDMAIGHTRYATAGDRSWHNAQPIFRASGEYGVAVAHNGNLTNSFELADRLFDTIARQPSDTEIIAQLISVSVARSRPTSVQDYADAVRGALIELRGAYSLAMLDGERIIGARDPDGFRPLCLGTIAPNGWVIASESPALDVIGAEFVREIEPGEVVIIDADGAHSFPSPEASPSHLCIFEFVYFARPDTKLLGKEVHGTRRAMGEYLAHTLPVAADMVMGVPDSGVPAAEGYALASGIPYGQGLVKNRYIGRTFINPGIKSRQDAIRRKLNVLEENVRGKRVVVVDDSIVRGSTTKSIVRLLKQAGAAEVHLRISSPPYRWPCFYGIDTPNRPDLIAANHSVEEITEILGADSLAYLQLGDLRKAIGTPEGFCDACLTGSYPVELSTHLAGQQVL
ncbi:MAG: amidophosphoribosyltransferase [Ferrimicrobium sp.]|uniref:amidophosphoribosyltransferase n=1 Tax=Ferrimicrobium sp. TaxID=2926050 RepID=UPI0026073217|nr:amidophosphoribosyltransferase [Ferrimicrobium sp.]